MSLDLSFIIPVYNVENYLEECVNSILCQIEHNCEIILVDDGSTDNSGEICDKLAFDCSVIKVIHKENGGLSSARNAGMQIASGAYVAFIDSDDRIAQGAASAILDWIHKGGADMCFMTAIKFYPNGRIEPMGDEITQEGLRNKTKAEILQYLALRPKYPGSVCTKIFRKAFLDQHKIVFPADRSYHEDLKYTLSCILAANSYDALMMPYYEYRQNRIGSITNRTTKKSYDDLCSILEQTVREYGNGEKPIDERNRYAMAFVAYEYTLLVWQYARLDRNQKAAGIKFLREYRWVLRFGTTKRIKAIRLLSSVCGIRCTSRLLDLYMNNRKKSKE